MIEINIVKQAQYIDRQGFYNYIPSNIEVEINLESYIFKYIIYFTYNV